MQLAKLLFLCAAALISAGCQYDDQVLPSESDSKDQLYTIEGHIQGKGIDVSGISVTDGVRQAVTGNDGAFKISNVPVGTYSVRPVKAGLKFLPNLLIVSIDNSNKTDQNFTAVIDLIEMVEIPGGRFVMGSTNGNTNERPTHDVTVSKFEIGKYEITQHTWHQVMGTRPSTFANDSAPVENVSWLDAVVFCNYLSARQGLTPAYTINGTNVNCDFTANGYRLPTEAEWEYACRAGTTTDRYSGNMSLRSNQNFFEPNLDTIAWYKYNSSGTTHTVGLKRPNGFGLHDMQGNVTEWCWDFWNNYTNNPQIDPTGPPTGTAHALRGGSWFDVAYEVRSAFHRSYDPTARYSGVGFRVARTIR